MREIEFQNVFLTFDGKEILNDFSFYAEKGEKVLITGKSGSGKSSLFRILLGFQNMDRGKIFVQGEEVISQDFRKIRGKFAYVNQEVSLRSGIVREVLKEISQFSGNNYDGTMSQELAQYFEFDLRLLEKDTEELSGGEKQRLGILLAIMLHRPIFLLDEITSALDEELKQKVVTYFEKTKRTVIVISHDLQWQEKGKFRKVGW